MDRVVWGNQGAWRDTISFQPVQKHFSSVRMTPGKPLCTGHTSVLLLPKNPFLILIQMEFFTWGCLVVLGIYPPKLRGLKLLLDSYHRMSDQWILGQLSSLDGRENQGDLKSYDWDSPEALGFMLSCDPKSVTCSSQTSSPAWVAALNLQCRQLL